MPGSLTYSSRGGAIVSKISEDFNTPITSDALYPGKTIDVIGTDPDGVAPETQIIAIEADIALTVPSPPFSPGVFKQGQRVSILNMGAHPITFPAAAFNATSKAEVLEMAEMIQLIFMAQIGWIPCDDDGETNRLPMTLWHGSSALPSNGRYLFHEKGLVLRRGPLPSSPSARLQTSSFALAEKVVDGSFTLTEDDHTVLSRGSTAATFTLPNPTSCSGREYRLVSEAAVRLLVVVGGSKVTTGVNTQIDTIAAGKGITVQSINSVWRKVGEF